VGDVSGVHAAGGSLALGELIDSHGSALAWDLSGRADLWAWMADILSDAPTRSPRSLLALIEWLPDDGAFAASLRANRDHYGKGSTWHLLADLWDLNATVAMAGSKKKPPQYPRPGAKKKAGGVPLMSLMPKRRPPAPVVEPTPPQRAGPRVAGQKRRG
jgi:hypothetical protein